MTQNDSTNTTNANNDQTVCNSCGEPLTASPEDLCPVCLLTGVLASEAATLSLSEPQAGPTPGTRLGYLGDYELLEEIGRGGMGVVYRARQSSLGRFVAVKVVLEGPWASAESLERLRAEARAAAQIQHPNIVAIHEIGEHDGQPFFSMDYVEGENLEEHVRRRDLKPRPAAELVRTLALAVEAAHRGGVLHRDLKPSNVLLDATGLPRISDFGLAKNLVASDGPATLTGIAMGTPGYMPPEQVQMRAGSKAGAPGPAADVYSLGAILYALLAGRPPVEAANPLDAMLRVLNAEPVALQRHHPTTPRDLETICLKCLRKDPAGRYGSARELADELGRFLERRPITARPVGFLERSVRWCRRRPWQAVAGLALVVLVFGLISTGIRARQARYAAVFKQAQASRLAGDPWRALEAISQAARIGPDDRLRQEAVRAISAPGARRVREVPFDDRVVADRHHHLVRTPDGRTFARAVQEGGNEVVVDLLTGETFDPKVLSLSVIDRYRLVPREPLDDSPIAGLRQLAVADRHVAYLTADDEILVWDLDRRRVTSTIPDVPTDTRQVVLSPGGQKLALGSTRDRGGIRVWDVGTPERPPRRLGQPSNRTVELRYEATFSPDSKLLALFGGEGRYGQIWIWDVESGREIVTLKNQGEAVWADLLAALRS